MTNIISFAGHKGGVGRTASAVNVAAALTKHFKKKVLLIDCDPQKNLTISLGYKEPIEATLYRVLRDEVDLAAAIIEDESGVFLIPSEFDLSGFEAEVASKRGREHILRKKIEGRLNDFDFVLLDLPPVMGQLTLNALTVSDFVLIPFLTETLSLEAIPAIYQIIEDVIEYTNDKLQLLGLFGTQFDARLVVHKTILQEARDRHQEDLLQAVIRRNVAITEAQTIGTDVFSYSPSSAGATDYLQLTKELLSKI